MASGLTKKQETCVAWSVIVALIAVFWTLVFIFLRWLVS